MKKYTQISLEEREKIYQLLKAGISLSAIAVQLGRHKSTISREIKRNTFKLSYLPDSANNLALKRKSKLLCKIERYLQLKAYIIERLEQDKWSPEMIAGLIIIEQKLPSILHESIYQYIYSYRDQKLNLYKHLMYARPKRQLKLSRRKHHIPDIYKIHNRPDIINKPYDQLSQKTIKSITFDNGGELKKFGLLALKGTNIFFYDPGAPYQKGQVERTNAILHKFIPKRSDFYSITYQQIENAQSKLNNLLRKCLNFSPSQSRSATLLVR